MVITINSIARISIISMSLYLLLVICLAWFGVSVYEYNYIFGHNLLSDVLLLCICQENNRYHCRYMRFQCYNLIFTDVLGFTDDMFALFEDAVTQLIVLSISWFLSASITVALAIQHFRRVNRVNKGRMYIHNVDGRIEK